ncbi:MAG: gliding motility-associated protein GldE [Bacteroidota bacterium]
MEPVLGTIPLLQLSVFSLVAHVGFFLLCIMISFLVSGAEVAFFSLTKAEVEEYRNTQTRLSQKVWSLVNQPQRLLATILIANNFVNVTAIILGTSLLKELATAFEWKSTVYILGWAVTLDLFLNIAIITSILLFFGEIVPKVFAARNKRLLVKILASPLESLKWIFSPLSTLLIKTTEFISTKVSAKEEATSLQDLKHAIDITTQKEEDLEETEILKGIVNFSNISVKSVMRARIDVIAVAVDTGLDELIALTNEHTYSRLPVYEENIDSIIGVLHIKDLLPFVRDNVQEVKLIDLIRPVQFVPESKKIDDLLEEFKTQRLHMAVVVDEYGGTAGIVTLNDVIEEIFGEITDEFDSEEIVYTKIDEDTFIFEGRVSLIDVKKIVDLPDEYFEDKRGDSDSLGGLIFELAGKFPNAGEQISYQNIMLEVESVSKTRINMVKLSILREVAESEE